VDPAAGLNAMPAFENQLTAPQIRVVAAYVWSLSNKALAK
jgi:mono/diheme cytochrome c family protein